MTFFTTASWPSVRSIAGTKPPTRVACAAALLLAACADQVGQPPDLIETPRVLWRTQGVAPVGPMAMDDSSVYVLDRLGVVHAVARSNGSVRWTVTVAGAGINGGMQVADGHVLAAVGPLLSVNLQSHQEAWRKPSSEGFGRLGLATAGQIVLPSSHVGRGEQVALHVVDGVERWRTPVLPVLAPFVDGDTVRTLAPNVDSGLTAVAFARWRSGEPQRGGVALLDVTSGAPRWSRMLPAVDSQASTFPSTAAIGGDGVAVSSMEGFIYYYDLHAGELRWTGARPQTPAGGIPLTSDIRPVSIAQQTVFAGSGRGSLTAYRVADGIPRWTVNPQQGGIVSIATFGGSRLVLTHFNGGVSVMSVAAGAILWQLFPRQEADRVYDVRASADTLFVSSVGGVAAYVFPLP